MIKYLWQLPQNLLGLLIKRITKAEVRTKYLDATVHKWGIHGGLSLGKYIFVPSGANLAYIKHEYGHTVQSKYLGWLYLIVIALPSLIWAGCFNRFRTKYGVSYYAFYTEKWAEKLGGNTNV